MAILGDIRVLYRLALSPIRGANHAERLESFYRGQAGAYDDFRRRLLHGRRELIESIPFPAYGVWIDMGGGTGSNIEYAGDRLAHLNCAYLVDLAPSLLEVARDRVRAHRWENVVPVEADATTFVPDGGHADVVTFSYSLTMIPDWFSAIDHALDLLKPGGTIGVVDFHVSRKFPGERWARHGWMTRMLWPIWFASDNVFLGPDQLPYLHRRFDCVQFSEHRAPVPYLPGLRVPYYRFVGRKR